jgi:hypothetical protein
VVIGILSGRVSWAANFLGSVEINIMEVWAASIGSAGGGLLGSCRGGTGMETDIEERITDKAMMESVRLSDKSC